MWNPGLGHPAHSTHLSLPSSPLWPKELQAQFGQRCSRYRGEGESCVKSDQEDKGGRARQGLNLLLVEGAPESPFSKPTSIEGPRAPIRPSRGWGGGTAPPSLSPMARPAKAGGPQPRPASPTGPPAYLAPPASRHGGRACRSPGSPRVRRQA